MADLKAASDWLPTHDAPDGKAWRCPDCPAWAALRENAHAHQIATGHGRPTLGDQPAPPSAEKLALRGEPTARTILQVFAAQAAHIPPSMTDDRPLYAYAGAPKITVGDFRRAAAYLSTRAPAEETALVAMYGMAAARRKKLAAALSSADWHRADQELMEAEKVAVDCARALPVEGRAPGPQRVICERLLIEHNRDMHNDPPECDRPRASHEKKLGKKGGD